MSKAMDAVKVVYPDAVSRGMTYGTHDYWHIEWNFGREVTPTFNTEDEAWEYLSSRLPQPAKTAALAQEHAGPCIKCGHPPRCHREMTCVDFGYPFRCTGYEPNPKEAILIPVSSSLPAAVTAPESADGFAEWLEKVHGDRKDRGMWTLTAAEIGLMELSWNAALRGKGGK